MKNFIFLCTFIFLGAPSWSQSESDIMQEATLLYKSEMASWHGTDIFLAKYGERRDKIDGYFSYVAGKNATCVFFSKGDHPMAIATFTFDSTYNTETAIIDAQERALTKNEQDLMTIRQTSLHEYQSDTLFRSYKNMNPNFIPISDAQGKRVYVLTGPQEDGIMVFGNDYLLTFDKNNTLKQKRQLHKNLISIKYGQPSGGQVLVTAHTHLHEAGDLITATDVCTLMLYGPRITWGQHFVMSDNNVSIWNCEKKELFIMTRKAWDRIMASEYKK